MHEKLLGTISVDSDIKGQLLIIYSAFFEYLKKNLKSFRIIFIVITKFRKIPLTTKEYHY